jgi:hypothetical protein
MGQRSIGMEPDELRTMRTEDKIVRAVHDAEEAFFEKEGFRIALKHSPSGRPGDSCFTGWHFGSLVIVSWEGGKWRIEWINE